MVIVRLLNLNHYQNKRANKIQIKYLHKDIEKIKAMGCMLLFGNYISKPFLQQSVHFGYSSYCVDKNIKPYDYKLAELC